MNKFMNAHETGTNIRWRLLATVSAIALLGSAYGMGQASAADKDSDRPLIWIELGGQLSRLDEGQEAFTPALTPARPSIFAPSQKFEKPPLYSIDETGKISFEPENSDWVFSASIRYGHSGSKQDVNQQTSPQINVIHYTVPGYAPKTFPQPPLAQRFAGTIAQNSEHHLILDFQAGKDVGLGMFGNKDGSSVVGIGVRFAQFGNTSSFHLNSDPDWQRLYRILNYPPVLINQKFVTRSPYHLNAASLHAVRSFHGVGPAISWNASMPFAGDPKDSELTFDWGVNAALLFGRQRTKVHHQTTSRYQNGAKYPHGAPVVVGTPIDTNHTRARSVTVPNVGGFAGFSFRLADFKASAGYRADFFFNAIDGGIDARKSYDRSFFGPFASISVGLGD